MPRHDVVDPSEHDSTRAGRLDPELISRMKSRCTKGVHGDRGLVLRADATDASSAVPYFCHKK